MWKPQFKYGQDFVFSVFPVKLGKPLETEGYFFSSSHDQ